jgi:peroxiredoxin
MSTTVTKGDMAPNSVLRDAASTEVRLSELWREHPLVLVFLRHFGWPFCHEHLRALRDVYQAFQGKGAAVAAVTQGTPEQTARLCERHSIPFRCLADPFRDAYRAFGLTRGGLVEVMAPQVLIKAALSAARGNFGPPGGDVFQMPGTFVIGTDGIIWLAYRSRDASDLLPMDTIFAALTL